MEIWKPIKEYEGYYSVSNFGRIRRDKPEHNTYAGRIISSIKKGRYERIGLTKNGKKKLHTIHRLVATTFLKKDKKRNYVNHKDSNRFNNHVDNLEWCSSKENMAHSLENGLQPQGSRAYNAKLNESQVLEIRKSYSQRNISQQEIADKFNVSQILISIIIRRKRWRHI